jgi:hypothetical protein
MELGEPGRIRAIWLKSDSVLCAQVAPIANPAVKGDDSLVSYR